MADGPGFFADLSTLASKPSLEQAWYLRQADAARAAALLPPAEASTGRAALVHADQAIQAWRHDDAVSLIARAEQTADDRLVPVDAALLTGTLAYAVGQVLAALEMADTARDRARAAGDREREATATGYGALVSIYAAPQTTRARLDSLPGDAEWPVVAVLAAVTQCMLDFNRGEHALAAQKLEQLVAHTERLGMVQLQLRMQNTLAAAYSNLDDKDTAIYWVERSIERARAAGWPVATGEALAFLGNFYRETRQTSRARETLEDARRTLSVAMASRGYALACCYLAHAHLDAGETREAAERALEAEAIAEQMNAFPIVIDVLTVAGRATARSGDPARGAELVRNALAIADEKQLPVWRVDALRAMAEIHAEHETAPPEGITADEAPLHYLREAQATIEATGGHAEKVAILRELSRAHERAGNLEAALAASREALEQTLSDDARRIHNRLLAVEARHQVERQRVESEAQRRLAEAHAARAELMNQANAELRKAQADLEVLASTDSMTGLANRRSFFAAAESEMARCFRYGRCAALIICDIDLFKSINDAKGHPCGDRVIIAAARTLSQGTRASDNIGRVGGEEFALLLPETDLATAQAMAERMRRAIEEAHVECDGERIAFTMSFGIAVHGPADAAREPLEALATLIHRADRALYEAKGSGRNRVAFGSGS